MFDYLGLAKQVALLHIKSLVFVHFFSGFRRPTDLHACLDRQPLGPGLEIHVISVDLCLQRVQGNLVSSEAHAFWRGRILAGQIVGAGGGPPCETFSAARFTPGGPRALRSDEFPHGVPGLRQGEYQQLLVGTRLLHFILDMLLLLASLGGFGF